MKITEILKNVLIQEQTKFELLFDKLTKPQKNKEGKKIEPKLSKTEFFTLLQGDPTTKLNDVNLQTASPEELSKVKAGKFVPWIIKNYLKAETERKPGESGYEEELKRSKELFMEDLYKITNDLRKFDRFKNRIEGERNIDKLTPHQLYNAVKDFSLEKTKGTAEEKKEAAKTYSYPGSKVDFTSNKWTVVKITDESQLGKDAACFFGGYHLEALKGETTWCTSSPGLTFFNSYIKQGPLYVIIPNNWTGKIGEKSGLPAERYQFHFPTDQFKDVHNHTIDFVKFLNENPDLKDYFKPEFAAGLSKTPVKTQGKRFVLEGLTKGAIGKYVSLYGLDELLNNIPTDIDTLHIINNDKAVDIIIKVPDLSKFKNLISIQFDNCINNLPDSVCKSDKLTFISVINNKDLKTIPECIADLPNLAVLHYGGSSSLKMPQRILDKTDKEKIYSESDILTFFEASDIQI
jgi:hypothetical protein